MQLNFVKTHYNWWCRYLSHNSSLAELNFLTNGHLPPSIRPLTSPQLAKNNGDLRPIVVVCTYWHC